MMFRCVVFGNNVNVDYVIKDDVHYVNISDLQCDKLNIITLNNKVMINGEMTNVRDYIFDKGYLHVPIYELLSIVKNSTFSKSSNTLTIY